MGFLSDINTMLTDAFGPLGPLLALGMLGLVLVLATIPAMLKKQPEPFSKLKAQRLDVAKAARNVCFRATRNETLALDAYSRCVKATVKVSLDTYATAQAPTNSALAAR